MLGNFKCSIYQWMRHPIVIVYCVFYLFRFSLALVDVPKVRLLEQALCERYYRARSAIHDHENIPEELCKLASIQKDLATITGWRLSFDAIPGVLTAAFYGGVADKYGRKAALWLAVLGEFLALLFMVLICFMNQIFTPKLVWLCSGWLLVGGGDRIFASILMTVIADNFVYSKRTKFLYLLGLMDSLSEISAPPIEAWTLSHSIWLPFVLALMLYVILVMLIYIIPNAQALQPTTSAEAAPIDAREPLLTPADGIEDPIANLRHPNVAVNVYGQRPWLETLELLKNPNLAVLLFCFLAKRIAFTSENFFPQYASQRFHLDLRHTPWFPWSQALGSIFMLGLILPSLTAFLRRSFAARSVDHSVILFSLFVLTVGFLGVWKAATPLIFAAAIFFCGLGEGAAPSLQGLASSFVKPFQNARLFAAVAIADTIGRVISGPLMAHLHSAGEKLNTEPTGKLFLASSCIFGFSFALACFIRYN